VLGGIIFNEISLRAARETELRHAAQRSAEQTALELERIVAGAHATLDAIAAAPVVRARDWAGCEQFLERLVERLPQYVSLGVIDAQGIARCRSDALRSNIDLSDRPYFREALSRPMSLVVADYTISRISGVATLPLSYAFGDKEDRLVAVVSLDLSWLQQLIQNRQLPPDGSITIADRTGTIIVRTPTPERFVGTAIPDQFHDLLTASGSGVIDVKSQDGTERYLGYVPVSAPPLGLYVSVGVGKNQGFAEINAGTVRTLLITVVALALATVLAVALSNSLVRGPILGIRRAIGARRSGDLSARTGLVPGRSELDDLGAAIDEYMDDLNDARAKQQLADQHRNLMSQELAHRLKNVIATVQAVARQTFRNGGDPQELLHQFDGRLQSIADAQQLLLAGDPEHVDLRKAIESAVRPFEQQAGQLFDLSGPELKILSKASLSLALALHELATNASKYGALTTEDGRVEITWETHPEQMVIRWIETGGPHVAQPTRKGFGSRMIEQLLAAELSGSAELLFEPAGLRCTIIAPLENIAGNAYLA
jgi:two-component sensor histidine kinase